MPVVNGVVLTPDEAIAYGLCPETGRPLSTVDIDGHIGSLWPKDRSEEAIRRIGLIKDWAAKNPPPAPEADPVKARADQVAAAVEAAYPGLKPAAQPAPAPAPQP